MKIYPLVTLKRWIEEIVMAPFVWWGKRWAANHPLTEEFDIFFFFPIYGLGGAEKVNADILDCVGDKKVIIFFTRASKETTSLHLFQKPFVTIKDISRWTDNKFRYWDNLFYRGVCAYYINKQNKKPVVFNGQCNFAYKLFPHLKKSIHKVELIHNSNKHFAWVVYPYVPFIDKRIMATDVHVKEYGDYYDKVGIAEKYKARMEKVLYKIEPSESSSPREEYEPVLNFYYAGRGGRQKRVWLLVKAIEQCLPLNLPIHFHLAGSFKNELPSHILKACTYHGQINGGKDMALFHQKMDVLMMTSAFEGFPVVIMEAMINGVVPVATSVDGVPEHIKHGENGLLIYNAQDEEGVVQQLVQHIIYLCNNRQHLIAMSLNAHEYAKNTFSPQSFCGNYRRVMKLDE